MLKALTFILIALALTGCHYRYDFKLVGDGGIGDKCPKHQNKGLTHAL